MALGLGRLHPRTKPLIERKEFVPIWRCGCFWRHRLGRPGALLLEPPMLLCIYDMVERAEILGTWALAQFCPPAGSGQGMIWLCDHLSCSR